MPIVKYIKLKKIQEPQILNNFYIFCKYLQPWRKKDQRNAFSK
jgi:hypothetical protein